MIMRHTIPLIAILSLVAACSEPPASPLPGGLEPALAKGGQPYLPGEQQTTRDISRGTLAIYEVGSGQILSQTFTPTTNDWLGFLELPVGCAADVLLNVKIREGLSGPILYEANMAGLPVVVDTTFQLLQVFNPATSHHGIKLHKNREYAFELAAFKAPAAVDSTCGIVQGPVGDSYGGGKGYYQDPINGPLFLPLPTGLSTDDEDLPFRTLVR